MTGGDSGQPTYYSATKLYQFLAAIAATLGAFGLGTVVGWTAHGTRSLKDSNDIGNISESAEDFIGCFFPLGALLCGPPTGFLIGKLGRKKTMLMCSLPFVLGWLLIAFAQNLAMVLAGRLVTGFFGGAFSLAAPVYIGEIAESSVRGLLGSGFQFMLTLGILFVYVLGGYVNYVVLSIVCAVVPVVFLAVMLFMPESPRWYVMVDKIEEAGKALAWLRGTKSPTDVQEELRDLQTSVEDAARQQASFKDLFHPSIFKPTLMSLLLMLFQQLSGINAVVFYVTDIFLSANTGINSSLSTNIIGIVQVVATLVGTIMVDRAGRRILLLISDIGMAISLVALGAYFSVPEVDRGSIGWLPLISLIVFISAFSIGFGPIPWMLLGEILPPRAKGLASAIATSFNWTLAFVVSLTFKPLQKGIGINWCYFMFAIICSIGTIYILTVVPETKGKSLDDIQRLFGPPQEETKSPSEESQPLKTRKSYLNGDKK